jgi:hypothetical protein
VTKFYSLHRRNRCHSGQDLVYQRDINYASLSYSSRKICGLNWLVAMCGFDSYRRSSGCFCIPISFASRKRGRCGCKQSALDYECLRNAPLKGRTTLEDACKKILLKHMKEGKVRKHTSSIKPYLINENKKARLQWCVDMLDHESLHGNPRFKSRFYHVFIDEKWFFLLANLRGTTCFPTKMHLTILVRARTISISSCSCVSHVV